MSTELPLTMQIAMEMVPDILHGGHLRNNGGCNSPKKRSFPAPTHSISVPLSLSSVKHWLKADKTDISDGMIHPLTLVIGRKEYFTNVSGQEGF